MTHFVTLISDPALPRVSDGIVTSVRWALEDAGAAADEPDWLAPQIACDIPFTGAAPDGVRTAARTAIARAPVDVVVTSAENRRKRLLVSDMESTIIRNEMVDDLAELLGVGGTVKDITRRAMNGEIPFRDALAERVALLGGLEKDFLLALCYRIVFMPGARTLVRTMRAHGALTALVSGGFRIYSEYVREECGFDIDVANDVVLDSGVLTGQLVEPIMGGDGKREAMEAFLGDRGLQPADALATGDGANDIAMIRAAGAGVAFRAKPAVAEAAEHRIDHGDLTALLYLQGYRRDEFVTVKPDREPNR